MTSDGLDWGFWGCGWQRATPSAALRA